MVGRAIRPRLPRHQEGGFPGKFAGYLAIAGRTQAARRAIGSCGSESANVQFLGMNAEQYSHPALCALSRVLAIVRLPLVAVLLLLEPVVNVVCGAAAVLGVLIAVAFEFSAVGPRFPFLQVTAISLSFGAFLILYHSALALLVRD